MQSTASRTAAASAAVLLAVLAALPAAAQRSDAEWLEQCRDGGSRWGSERARFCEVRTETLRPTGRIAVDGGENGGASVRGSDANEVRVSARIQAHAATEAEARDVARRVAVRTDGGSIRADGPAQGRGAGWSVVFHVEVPRRQDVSVTTKNGPVAVEGVSGRMTLRAENGPVALRRVGGAVNARVRNGPVTVELDGDRWNGEGLDAESVNGPVTLRIPARYSAELEVGNTHGPARIDLPLSGGYRSGRHVRTTLGSGGAPVRVVTTNGPIVVTRTDR